MSFVYLPAILRSLIFLQSCSAFLIGQFSTFALKLLKNLYSLKWDILLSILEGVWPEGGGEFAFALDGDAVPDAMIVFLMSQSHSPLKNPSKIYYKFGFLIWSQLNYFKFPLQCQYVFKFDWMHIWLNIFNTYSYYLQVLFFVYSFRLLNYN